MLKKIFSLFVCAMMCLISTNLVFADGTVDIHGTYSIHVGGYDWGSATNNKKAENILLYGDAGSNKNWRYCSW